jgi:hypothetical protein
MNYICCKESPFLPCFDLEISSYILLFGKKYGVHPSLWSSMKQMSNDYDGFKALFYLTLLFHKRKVVKVVFTNPRHFNFPDRGPDNLKHCSWLLSPPGVQRQVPQGCRDSVLLLLLFFCLPPFSRRIVEQVNYIKRLARQRLWALFFMVWGVQSKLSTMMRGDFKD